VIIGRNEGQRLIRCLESVDSQVHTVIYVDSDSTDDSVSEARQRGAQVVELDQSRPFTAARARKAGLAALLAQRETPSFVQFIDGDCELNEQWISTAANALEADAKLAVVCGRRRERFPEASLYNRLADMEWDTPIGLTRSCGGDAMMRVEALEQVGGFNEAVIAGEEPELCFRLRQAGWKIRRIDAPMTLHDADMHRFGQWWKRAVRGGYGSFDVWRRTRHGDEPLYGSQVRSAWIWTVGWLLATIGLAIVMGMMIGLGAGAVAVGMMIGLWTLQALRIGRQGYRRGLAFGDSLAYGCLTMISKWAELKGHSRWITEKLAGREIEPVEYKQA
jgi:glycosyltransferase involved in cell wall biosynthesis